jgi:hypothetical protein
MQILGVVVATLSLKERDYYSANAHFNFKQRRHLFSLSFSVDWQMHLDTQLTRRVTCDSIVQTRVSVIPTYDKVERNSATELSFELY